MGGDEKEKNGGYQGEGYKGHYQFGLKLRPENFLLSLKNQLNYIA